MCWLCGVVGGRGWCVYGLYMALVSLCVYGTCRCRCVCVRCLTLACACASRLWSGLLLMHLRCIPDYSVPPFGYERCSFPCGSLVVLGCTNDSLTFRAASLSSSPSCCIARSLTVLRRRLQGSAPNCASPFVSSSNLNRSLTRFTSRRRAFVRRAAAPFGRCPSDRALLLMRRSAFACGPRTDGKPRYRSARECRQRAAAWGTTASPSSPCAAVLSQIVITLRRRTVGITLPFTIPRFARHREG